MLFSFLIGLGSNLVSSQGPVLDETSSPDVLISRKHGRDQLAMYAMKRTGAHASDRIVQSLSRVQLFATSRTAAHQVSCPLQSPGACSNSCPLSQWCYPTVLSSIAFFSSCPQSFPASGSFIVSQLFASGGQSIEASASASVLSMNIQFDFL